VSIYPGNSLQPEFGEQLAAARGGCTTRLGELFEACRQYLLAVAEREFESRRQGKVSPSDIVQDTFMEARKAFANFSGNSPNQWRAWLRQILIHNLIDHGRRRHREESTQTLPIDVLVGGTADPQFVDQHPTPSRQLLANEAATELAAALRRLSSDHRWVIRLRHQHGLRFSEIGEHMGRSTDAVQKLWMRAVCRLREELLSGD
jgi:RNA polymerase sigma-70 factor (ECF subfamily)